MSQKSESPKLSSERVVNYIRRVTRKQYPAKEKICNRSGRLAR